MKKIKTQAIENIHRKIVPNFHTDNPLSAREMECLIALAKGKNPDQCAALMQVAYCTIVNYERSVRLKLGVYNRAQALYTAIQYGYLKVENE